MKIKAKDFQAGDVHPVRGTVTNVAHLTHVVFDHQSMVKFEPECEVEIERPVPTVTIEIPLKLAEELTRQEWASQRLTVVKAACQEALRETHTEAPVLRVGAKVRRTNNEDRVTGRYGVGTVTGLVPGGSQGAFVTGPNGRNCYWERSAFVVVL